MRRSHAQSLGISPKVDPVKLDAALTALAALLLALVLTGVMRKLAVAHGVLDVPNDRSSHRVPTPRGGGVAIALSTIAASIILVWRGALDIHLFLALTGGGIAVAFVGFLDDRRQLSARIRLAAHLAAALWALLCLGGLPPMRYGDQIVSLGWTGYVVGALGIAWTLNLFNFMDGIDGIAASEAVFIVWGGALLALLTGQSAAVPTTGLVFGAVCCGFLAWNWPPAKIFMGDVGSGYVGYVVVVLAVAAARENPVALLVWLILGGVFFCDATVTLVRRLTRGERVYEAHRTHAYQWLARRWVSHRSVTIAVSMVNLAWLFPCAWLATVYPGHAAWIVIVALAPPALLAFVAGAGRHVECEREDHKRR
jgi:Fuc2NAc and GlcNAc transferase